MLTALALIRSRNGGRDLPCYAHPDMFRERATKLKTGGVREAEPIPGVADLKRGGAQLVLTTDPQAILDAMFYVSGEIPRVTAFEAGLPGQVRRTVDGQDWESDELVKDERYLAVNVRGKGLVVLTACSHAGIVNVLTDARRRFARAGSHHAGRTASRRHERADHSGHGGGTSRLRSQMYRRRPLHRLAGPFPAQVAFGNKVVAPMAVGKRYMI